MPIEYERIVATYEDGFLIVFAPIAVTAYLPTARTELHVLVKGPIPNIMAQKTNQNIVPANLIGILPLQEAVLFPHTVIPLAVVKKSGIQLVEEALREGKPIGLTVLRDRETEDPGPDDIQRVGTIGVIQKMLKVPDGTLRCIVAGQQVFRIEQFTQVAPYMVAAYTELPDTTVENEELVAMQRNLAGLFQKLLSYLPQAPREMEMEVANITDPVVLTYFVALTMRLETADRQALLEERDTAKRMRKLTLLLTKELEVVELGHKIQSDIQREMEKNQREFYLRQQLRAIQEELGEVDPQQAETNELRTKIDAAAMPQDVKKAADRELDRLSKVPQASPEYSVIRTYLDWLVTLPWNEETADHIDIQGARGARRRPLRSRQDQRPDHRVSGGRQAQEETHRPDSLLRGSARRR